VDLSGICRDEQLILFGRQICPGKSLTPVLIIVRNQNTKPYDFV